MFECKNSFANLAKKWRFCSNYCQLFPKFDHNMAFREKKRQIFP
jgi:hypothetical protein